MDKIVIDDDIYLSPPTDTDKWAFVKYLNDEDIYKFTLRVPYPYTELDAETFLNKCREQRKQYGRNIYWMIRRNGGEAVGGISFLMTHHIDSHKQEVGYWLGREYWSHGIMTKVLKKFVDHGFSYLGLTRIEAGIFNHNTASQRVLEKSGFTFEGEAKKYYEKKGKHIDAKLFAVVK